MNDPTTASDSIVVNRTCDDLLSYAVSVDGHSFPIGTTIPMHLTMIPIGKTRVHCITCTLEEQTVYYANERKTMRQELSLIHISEPTRREWLSRMPSSA